MTTRVTTVGKWCFLPSTMKPHKKPKIPKPRVPRWTAHMEAKAREVPSTPAKPRPRSHSIQGIPMIPSDALKADPSRQLLGWGSTPKPYYRDELFVCKSCGKLETWTALQQRWWYEIARGPIDTTAVACRACRKAKRASDTESLHKAWMARFERLKRLQPQLKKPSGLPTPETKFTHS